MFHCGSVNSRTRVVVAPPSGAWHAEVNKAENRYGLWCDGSAGQMSASGVVLTLVAVFPFVMMLVRHSIGGLVDVFGAEK